MDTWMGYDSDPLSLHKYLYSGSDPVNHVDPSGHFFSLGEVQATQTIQAELTTFQIDIGMNLLNLAANPTSAAEGFAQNSGIALGVSALGGAGGSLLKLLNKKWKDIRDITFSPVKPGPLSISAATTFRSATYTQKVLKEPVELYRLYGGNARQLSNYWTRTRPSGPLQNGLDSAILDEFGNLQNRFVKIRVPEGQIIFEGAAARQLTEFTIPNQGVRQDLIGGGNQVYIQSVDPSWIVN
jgi:hypothetical protein